jgi:DNA mismatch endonuclease (patch repair protein)
VVRDREQASQRKEVRRAFKRTERRLVGKRTLVTTRAISERMGRIRQRGTGPELTLRRAVRSRALRFTTKNSDLPGSPDLANRRRKFAIFVHGCFWHRHGGCGKATLPKSNKEFWENKFARNLERDREVVVALRALGYRIVVIWECEVGDDELVETKLQALKCQPL